MAHEHGRAGAGAQGVALGSGIGQLDEIANAAILYKDKVRGRSA